MPWTVSLHLGGFGFEFRARPPMSVRGDRSPAGFLVDVSVLDRAKKAADFGVETVAFTFVAFLYVREFPTIENAILRAKAVTVRGAKSITINSHYFGSLKD
jgi:hypothetical protein